MRSDDSRCQTEEPALLAQRQFVAGSKILGKLNYNKEPKKNIYYIYMKIVIIRPSHKIKNKKRARPSAIESEYGRGMNYNIVSMRNNYDTTFFFCN